MSFWQFISDHHEFLLTIGGFALMAIINTMPTPGSWKGFSTIYAWIYAAVQEFLSLRSAKFASSAEPKIQAQIPASALPETSTTPK